VAPWFVSSNLGFFMSYTQASDVVAGRTLPDVPAPVGLVSDLRRRLPVGSVLYVVNRGERAGAGWVLAVFAIGDIGAGPRVDNVSGLLRHVLGLPVVVAACGSGLLVPYPPGGSARDGFRSPGRWVGDAAASLCRASGAAIWGGGWSDLSAADRRGRDSAAWAFGVTVL
jgi:hypothetical protein